MSAASATSNIILRDRKSARLSVGQGLKIEEIQAYYDEAQFKDWTHADTGAPVLKRNIRSSRCGIKVSTFGRDVLIAAMPYKREGALKISDHHVRSPVLNINRACQTVP